jgi:prephenate dehydratase
MNQSPSPDCSLRIGYQGEEHSYSHRATGELFPGSPSRGFLSFGAAFSALADGLVDRLVLPIENSTTGSVLEVLDRLTAADASIAAEHLVRVSHALLGRPGARLEDVRRVLSHPEALAQARDLLAARGWKPVPVGDTAGAVREVARRGDPEEAALAPPESGPPHGLEPLLSDVADRAHNTTRFVVLVPGPPTVGPDSDKTSLSFSTEHRPGALALAITELGLRGANLTRIESRPTDTAWSYRFYVDLIHQPGPEGLARILHPRPSAMNDLIHLGTFRSRNGGGAAAPGTAT